MIEQNQGRPKVSARLLEMCRPYPLVKFSGKAYLCDKQQAYEVGSTQHKDFLSRIYYQNTQSGLTESQRKEVIEIQRAQALCIGTERNVYLRTAAISETLTFIDLCDGKGTIIEVSAKCWKIADNPDVLFFRPANLKALPLPTKTGDAHKLRKFLNLSNESDFLLILAALVFILRGRPMERGSYMILVIKGIEGSAKSTCAKILKSIVDPGTPETRTPTNDIRDLYIAANRCHVLNLDNLSHIIRDLSDAICSLITGGGFARKLNYSDDEESIFERCVPIILNGITFKSAPDLLSRSITFSLDPISDESRKTESEIWQELESVRAEIFSGLLTMLSNALSVYEKGFDCPPLPRLADFGRFSIALEIGNDMPKGQIISALRDSYDDALDGIAEENPLIEILSRKLTENKRIEGTASDILSMLNDAADDRVKRLEVWPKTAAGLGALLSRQYNVLRKKSITVKQGTGRNRRKWIITENKDAELEIPW